jgi:hypothetical protein
MPLVIMLAGHGSVGATRTVIDSRNHQIFFTVKSGDILCLTAHNMITTMFSSAQTRQGILDGLERLAQIPTIEHVSNPNCIYRFRNSRCETSFTLLEHKIWPNLSALSRPDAYLPFPHEEGYSLHILIHGAWLNQTTSITLKVLLNLKKLCEAVLSLRARKATAAELGDDQAVYMTPFKREGKDSTDTLALSAVISFLPLIRIVVYCGSRLQDDMDVEFDWFANLQNAGPHTGASQDLLTLRHVMVFLDEPGVEKAMLQSYPDVTSLERYVFRLPADSAIVLMICREWDATY